MAKVTPISEHFLRTTNIIERCFVEVGRRTRPMVCFVDVQSVDRIIYSIFQRFKLGRKNRTLRVFYTSSLTSPERCSDPRPIQAKVWLCSEERAAPLFRII